jgi:nucleoside-diphosphate-sugar epimerase
MIGSDLKTILVTGGNGFICNQIIKKLLNKYNFIVLEKNTNNLFRLSDIKDKIQVYDIDLINPEQIFKSVKIDIILHTATIYGRNNEPLKDIIDTNILLPFQLFCLGKQYKSDVFINSDTVLNRNTGSYALSKAQLKEWLKMYSANMKVVNLQFEHFYGPGSSSDNFISLIINKMLANVPEIDLTKGEQKRAFTYYTDIVEAYILIINSVYKLSAQYSDFKISSDELISIRKLVEEIKKIIKSKSKLNFGVMPYRENELMDFFVNNDAIKKLGWTPTVSLESGLKKTIDFIKKNQEKIV